MNTSTLANPSADRPQYLTREEVAEVLRISLRSVDNLIASKRLRVAIFGFGAQTGLIFLTLF